jgi:hypothetical protein
VTHPEFYQPTFLIMQTNTGNLDRILRIFAAFTLFALFYTDTVTGTLGLIGLALSVIFLGTAIMGNCPLYRLLGVSTCSRKV